MGYYDDDRELDQWSFDDKHVNNEASYKVISVQEESFKEKIKSFVFTGLKLSSKIVERLPDRRDNKLSVAIKVANIIETIHREFNKADDVQAISKKYNAVIKGNKQFVNMFMTTGVSDLFKVVKRINVGEKQHLVHLHHPDTGSIYFLECFSKNDTFYREAFLHSKDFDFEALAHIIWKLHNGRIEVRRQETLFGYVYQYMTFPDANPALFGDSKNILEQTKEKHLRFAADHVSRTYIFLGKPGVGKTTMALKFASDCGGKIMRLGASLLGGGISAKDLGFLLDTMRPSFIIIDDIDKANYKTMPELLSLMEQIKSTHPNVTFLLTANKTTLIEESLLRPGRIDCPVVFKDPNEEDRLTILKGYVNLMNINITEDLLKILAKLSKRMTGAWLQEVCFQLKYSDYETAEKYTVNMARFIKLQRGEDDDEDEEENSETSTNSTPSTNGKSVAQEAKQLAKLLQDPVDKLTAAES